MAVSSRPVTHAQTFCMSRAGWVACHNTWLLIQLTPEGVVFPIFLSLGQDRDPGQHYPGNTCSYLLHLRHVVPAI